MQLQPGERSLLAYFDSYADASLAAGKLQELGYPHVQMDSMNHHSRRTTNTFPNSISSMTGVGENAEYYRSYGPLLAADPVVSGMSASTPSSNYAYLVTVVTQDSHYQNAVDTLRSYGANI